MGRNTAVIRVRSFFDMFQRRVGTNTSGIAPHATTSLSTLADVEYVLHSQLLLRSEKDSEVLMSASNPREGS